MQPNGNIANTIFLGSTRISIHHWNLATEVQDHSFHQGKHCNNTYCRASREPYCELCKCHDQGRRIEFEKEKSVKVATWKMLFIFTLILYSFRTCHQRRQSVDDVCFGVNVRVDNVDVHGVSRRQVAENTCILLRWEYLQQYKLQECFNQLNLYLR